MIETSRINILYETLRELHLYLNKMQLANTDL